MISVNAAVNMISCWMTKSRECSGNNVTPRKILLDPVIFFQRIVLV